MSGVLTERKKRGLLILKKLKELFPDVKIALQFSNDWEMLVAVILSAQCTDKMVNIVTKELFKKYKILDDYVRANPKVFEQDIKRTGFYRNKTKNILGAAKVIKEEYGGVVPDSMEELLKIPGVARKTANVILWEAYKKNEGIAVDTHVRRFAQKFDLSDHSDPNKIEKDLMNIIPQEEWGNITYLLIEYGRRICSARPHDCSKHHLTLIYPKAANIWPRSK